MPIALVVNAVKIGVQEQYQEWEEIMLVRPAYLSLPLAFPAGFILFALISSVSHGKLLALFEFTQRAFSKHRADVFYDDEEEENRQALLAVPRSLQLSYIAQVLLSGNHPLCSPPHLAERLGSVSVLCCANKEGVLTDNVNYIDKISVMRHSDDDCSGSTSVDREMVIFELSRDPGRRKGWFRFNDLNWQEEHLVRLKPLGLNCLLNSRCAFGRYPGTKCVSPLHCGDKIEGATLLFQRWDQCLCLLGKEIGFAEGALDSFVPLREIHRWKRAPKVDPSQKQKKKHLNHQETQPRSRPRMWHMVSVVAVESNSGAMQLLSKGDPGLVIDCCSNAFDGTGIRSFTDGEKRRIFEMQKQWGSHNCLAFAYKPVGPEFASHFLPSSTDGQPIDLFDEDTRGTSEEE